MIEDVLQLDSSYQTAFNATHRRFIKGGNCLYEAEESGELRDQPMKDIWELVLTIITGTEQDKASHISSELVESMNWLDEIPVPLAYKLGSFLITEVVHRYRRWLPTQLERAWQNLRP